MAEMPGMIRPDLQALPQVRDRMTFLYLELAQACGQMLDGTFPRTRGGDPSAFRTESWNDALFPAHAGVILPKVNFFSSGLSFPRTRGGDSGEPEIRYYMCGFSPHTRG